MGTGRIGMYSSEGPHVIATPQIPGASRVRVVKSKSILRAFKSYIISLLLLLFFFYLFIFFFFIFFFFFFLYVLELVFRFLVMFKKTKIQKKKKKNARVQWGTLTLLSTGSQISVCYTGSEMLAYSYYKPVPTEILNGGGK